MKAQHNLEHQILKSFNDCTGVKLTQGQPQNFVLGVSGGLDSVALLNAFSKILPPEKIKILHFHHGNFGVNKDYRDSAQSHVQKLSAEYGVSLILGKSSRKLSSEAEFRAARIGFYKNSIDSSKDVMVLAHHGDDYLETQLIKLIRGSSLMGLNENFEWKVNSIVGVPLWRPWFSTLRSEILSYAQSQCLKWVEDPSNLNVDYLRNWIRMAWLPQLETKRSGSQRALLRSLTLVGQSSEANNNFSQEITLDSFSLVFWQTLSDSDKARFLALWFYKRKWTSVTSHQIKELKKD